MFVIINSVGGFVDANFLKVFEKTVKWFPREMFK